MFRLQGVIHFGGIYGAGNEVNRHGPTAKETWTEAHYEELVEICLELKYYKIRFVRAKWG